MADVPRRKVYPLRDIGIGIVLFGVTTSLPGVDNFLIDFTSLSLNSLQMVILGMFLLSFHFLYRPALNALQNTMRAN